MRNKCAEAARTNERTSDGQSDLRLDVPREFADLLFVQFGWVRTAGVERVEVRRIEKRAAALELLFAHCPLCHRLLCFCLLDCHIVITKETSVLTEIHLTV